MEEYFVPNRDKVQSASDSYQEPLNFHGTSSIYVQNAGGTSDSYQEPLNFHGTSLQNAGEKRETKLRTAAPMEEDNFVLNRDKAQSASYSYQEPLNFHGTSSIYVQNAGGKHYFCHAKLEDYVHLPPPIGLKLEKTPSAMKEIEDLWNAKERVLKEETKKFTVVHFPATLLRIGQFNFAPTHGGDTLMARCYISKRKFVWEILDTRKNIKNKVEVLWQNILSMRAIVEENKPGILEIELGKEPVFYQENDPMPRKHTTWLLSGDFTEGHALTYRRHYLEFPPGVLSKHYEKLLQSDNDLLKLSEQPFPSLNSPFFGSTLLDEETDVMDEILYALCEGNPIVPPQLC